MTLTLDNIVALVTLIAALGGLWWRIEAMCRKNTDDLAAFKLNVAENYVSKTSLREAIKPLSDMIGGIKDSVDHINQRFDAFLQDRLATRNSA